MYSFINRMDGVIVTRDDDYAAINYLFQPIYSPRTKRTIYYEVLSRVTSQSGEIYSNQDFFESVDDEFIKSVCLSQLQVAKSLKIKSTISLNINMSCLSDDQFVQSILLFKGAKIALEINELNCYTSAIQTLNNIKSLQSNGVMIWLDDYHSNNEQANLSLGTINWDYIKIDKSFLYFNSLDVMSAKALTYVLSPFTKKGLIFEGVETYEQAQIVKATGSLSQGYYYSVPKQWSEIMQDIKNGHKNKITAAI
ncbi:EAL domain-containing protein [Vibrio parahaemolyticus]|nr:EAL domain-containing protein [Vibrio parahaemolyticus]MDF5618505.1 EAL domain-containing protein [Vibrio parahaemolyticus]HAS6193147.1 EAL domain-containing protein [Vibrio vulnificus]